MSFRNQLIIWLAVLLTPVVLSDIYFHYEQYITERNSALDEQLRTAELFSAAMDTFIDRTVTLERSVGEAMVESSWSDPSARHNYILSVLEMTPSLRQISLLNPTGVIVESAPRGFTGVSIADRDYFRAIKSGADRAVSHVLVGKLTNQPTLVIAAAVRSDSGDLLGVVISAVNEATLIESLNIRPAITARLVLIDPNGRVAIASGFPKDSIVNQDWSRYSFVKQALRGQYVHVDSFNLRGEPVLTGGAAPIPSIGSCAAAFIPRSEVVEPVRQGAWRDTLISVTILLITLIVGTFLARQMVVPIERLSNTAEALGSGNLEAQAQVPATEELAILATTINQMADSIRQRDHALREAYERERRIATALQQRVLPEVPERVGNVELAVGYFPALKEAEIGGDFYDVLLLPNGLIGLLIADVSGKGLSAAVNTAMAKYMLEGFASENPDPALGLTKLNAALCQHSEEWRFITAFYGVLDPTTGTFTYANAGHLQPVIRHADGKTETLEMPSGPPLSITNEPGYHAESLELVEGDSILCYTDGVIEARREDEWFGEDRLEEVISRGSGAPEDVIRDVRSAVDEFSEGRQSDDIAMLAVRFGPKKSEVS